MTLHTLQVLLVVLSGVALLVVAMVPAFSDKH